MCQTFGPGWRHAGEMFYGGPVGQSIANILHWNVQWWSPHKMSLLSVALLIHHFFSLFFACLHPATRSREKKKHFFREAIFCVRPSSLSAKTQWRNYREMSHEIPIWVVTISCLMIWLLDHWTSSCSWQRQRSHCIPIWLTQICSSPLHTIVYKYT